MTPRGQEIARRMAQRVVAALWRFDSASLEDLTRIIDGMIKTKKNYEKQQQDTVRRAGQLQLDYTVKGEKAVEVPSRRAYDEPLNNAAPVVEDERHDIS